MQLLDDVCLDKKTCVRNLIIFVTTNEVEATITDLNIRNVHDRSVYS
jgi:hypothetical protein